MTVYLRRPSRRKHYPFASTQLDLFLDSAPHAAPALISPTLAETRIARRFGVSLSLARVFAEQANLGGHA